MKFELYPRLTWRGRRWFWRLRARNGRIVAVGEGYRHRLDATEAISLVRAAATAPLEELSADKEEMP